MKITFIRHAQSKYNCGEAKFDEKNVDLSLYGKEQSKNLDMSFDLLILSPLKRAIATYTNSNIKVGNVEISYLFREYKNGPLNFLENEVVEYETEEQVDKRVDEAIKYLTALKNENVGIISHHDFLQKLLKKLLDKDFCLTNTGYVVVNSVLEFVE